MLKRRFSISVIIICLLTAPAFAKKNMAIMEFKTHGIAASEINLIRDALESIIVSDTDISLVDRNKTGKILKEQEIQLSGITNSENAVKPGQLMNVHFQMFADILKNAGKYYITLKVTSVENAKTVGTLRLTGDTVQDLIKEIEEKVPGEFNGLATLEIFYPQFDDSEKDNEIDVQTSIINNHPQFSVGIKEPESGAELYFDISKIDIAYFSKIRISFDKPIPGKIEFGVLDAKEKEGGVVELNKLTPSGPNTYEVSVSDLEVYNESEWTDIFVIFPEKMKNTKFIIKELVVLP